MTTSFRKGKKIACSDKFKTQILWTCWVSLVFLILIFLFFALVIISAYCRNPIIRSLNGHQIVLLTYFFPRPTLFHKNASRVRRKINASRSFAKNLSCKKLFQIKLFSQKTFLAKNFSKKTFFEEKLSCKKLFQRKLFSQKTF